MFLAAAAVSFTVFRLSRRPAPPPEQPAPEEEAGTPTATNAVSSAAAQAVDAVSPAERARRAKRAAQWEKRIEGRTFANRSERVLFAKLVKSEEEGNDALAADTIERLRRLPSVADLDDFLARRLGEINFAALMSDRPTIWTTTVKVRHRGITPKRIAGEHGTTKFAVHDLNRLPDFDTVAPGSVLRVLHFQKALLVIRKSRHAADLSLNGRFFKRYYGVFPASAPVGTYSVSDTVGPRDIFARLGIRFVDSDVRELCMFLAPGATLTLAD